MERGPSLGTPATVSAASSSPAQKMRREAVAPLDFAQERLAVVRVTNGARPDGEHALRAEALRLPPVVDEHVPDAGDRGRQQDAATVDRLAQTGDRLAANHFLDTSVVDVGDQQARRVRPEVDGGDPHPSHRKRCARTAADSPLRTRAGTRASGASRVALRATPHLDVEPRARVGKPVDGRAESGLGGGRAIEMNLDLCGGRRDPIRLRAEARLVRFNRRQRDRPRRTAYTSPPTTPTMRTASAIQKPTIALR